MSLVRAARRAYVDLCEGLRLSARLIESDEVGMGHTDGASEAAETIRWTD